VTISSTGQARTPAANADAAVASFSSFALSQPIAAALQAAGYATPTPIQIKAIPVALQGRDVIAIAQTGTGKTAAFALPMLQKLALEPRRTEPRRARMVVLSPTRELATQIAESFASLGANLRFSIATIFGGVSDRAQIAAAERGIDVLVATPGRMAELVERGALKLDRTEVFVLDEADRMLDLGFIREVRKLMRLLPKQRQSMMFSATMPPAIREIAEAMMTDPVRISVTPAVVTVEKIRQSVYHVPAAQKRALLVELLRNPDMQRVVVFCRTKAGANRVTDYLKRSNLEAAAIHGNKSQNAREAALQAFKDGEARVLVATDIASRGIDAPGVTHVVNFELPMEAEAYVHRIGRSARAGRDGAAISFCDPAERAMLKQIERLTKVIPEVLALPELSMIAPPEPRREDASRDGERRNQGRRPGRGQNQGRGESQGRGDGQGQGRGQRQGQGASGRGAGRPAASPRVSGGPADIAAAVSARAAGPASDAQARKPGGSKPAARPQPQPARFGRDDSARDSGRGRRAW
jgi:ATP-dependent RNA helicase RhlE